MSEEDFLKRWSRRKQEAKAEVKTEALPEALPEALAEALPKALAESQAEAKAVSEASPPANAREADDGTAPEMPQAAAEPDVDLSKLPPIDSITAETDVTAFLRKNIPLDLSRAALRRAWAADPAIRDFVGLAENAWDFTDPTAMPGFGPLDHTPEQIASLVERVVGGFRDTAEKLASSAGDDLAAENAAQPTLQGVKSPDDPVSDAAVASGEDTSVLAASQPAASQDEEPEASPPTRRSHGGALPH